MELTFRQRLDRPDAKGRAPIFGDLHWAGRRWKIPTGVKCLEAHWQPTKNKRINTSAPDANALNLRLTRLQQAVQDVFLKAEANKRSEADVTEAELRQALFDASAGSQRMAPPEAPPPDPDASLPATTDWQVLHDRWHADSQGRLSDSGLKGLQQVVKKLAEFDPALRIGTLTKERLAAYTAWLFDQGYKDSTVTRHYWFLRECCQLVGRPVPKWMVMANVRIGRAVSLQRAELTALARVPLPPNIARERDIFLLQALLLLRESDLRNLRPHHVRQVELPDWGPVWCAELYQQKTGEPVLVPMPPLAVTIWQHYEGKLPMHTNQTRNVNTREACRLAGLNRDFVSVAFSGRTKHEAVGPVWDAVSTHTARHTGAALLVWAADGDQTLKECALGHVSESVYGYDTVERYGPRILAAWEKIFGEDRGLFPEDRGQLPKMPPVTGRIPATRRRFLPDATRRSKPRPE
jgi:integrase